MSKIDHDRWLLKLIDDGKRNVLRISRLEAGRPISPDGPDPMTEPERGVGCDVDDRALSAAMEDVALGRSAETKVEIARGYGRKVSVVLEERASCLHDSEQHLRTVCRSLLRSLLMDVSKNSQTTVNWLAWWLRKERRLRGTHRRYPDLLEEFLDAAFDEAIVDAKKIPHSC